MSTRSAPPLPDASLATPTSCLPPDPAPPASPSARDLFKVFAMIGLTSFGGGLSGWMMREIVQRRGWLTEADFLSGLALAQAFPGVNVVNLAIWLGFRLKGGQGALAASLGLVLPPMAVVLGLAGAFAQVAHIHAVHAGLAGIAAAAVGLSLQTGLRAARRAARDWLPLLFMAATFVAIFVLRLPLLWVVGALAPLSIATAYLRLHGKAAG
jgi:chromate transporter